MCDRVLQRRGGEEKRGASGAREQHVRAGKERERWKMLEVEERRCGKWRGSMDGAHNLRVAS